jgi:hypothetical protein
VLPWVVATVGVALAGAGILVFAAANRSMLGGGDFGWSAYAPLEPGDPAPYVSGVTFGDGRAVIWTTGHLVGVGLLVLGLLTLAGLGGWLLGLRRGRSQGR